MNQEYNAPETQQVESSQCETSTRKVCCLKKKMKVSKVKKRKIAKIGLVSTLALTTVSGFVKGGYGKKVHVASGLAFLGFAAWHASLYRAKKCANTVESEAVNNETIDTELKEV